MHKREGKPFPLMYLIFDSYSCLLQYMPKHFSS